MLSLLRAGGVFYGGLLGALVTAIVLVRRYRLRLWTTADIFAPGIALGHVVGRLGCLLAGCCYGRPTDVPWAITFTNQAAADNVGTPLGVPLHPTQLYDAFAELAILAVLLATERRGRAFEGRTFWLYMLLYAVSRFIIEFYRGDDRGMILGVSTSQFVSLVVAPLAIVMLVRLRARRPA
jgi:phosphatidylglycerol:prolipoprotein diacylglycerol transferase